MPFAKWKQLYNLHVNGKKAIAKKDNVHRLACMQSAPGWLSNTMIWFLDTYRTSGIFPVKKVYFILQHQCQAILRWPSDVPFLQHQCYVILRWPSDVSFLQHQCHAILRWPSDVSFLQRQCHVILRWYSDVSFLQYQCHAILRWPSDVSFLQHQCHAILRWPSDVSFLQHRCHAILRWPNDVSFLQHQCHAILRWPSDVSFLQHQCHAILRWPSDVSFLQHQCHAILRWPSDVSFYSISAMPNLWFYSQCNRKVIHSFNFAYSDTICLAVKCFLVRFSALCHKGQGHVIRQSVLCVRQHGPHVWSEKLNWWPVSKIHIEFECAPPTWRWLGSFRLWTFFHMVFITE